MLLHSDFIVIYKLPVDGTNHCSRVQKYITQLSNISHVIVEILMAQNTKHRLVIAWSHNQVMALEQRIEMA